MPSLLKLQELEEMYSYIVLQVYEVLFFCRNCNEDDQEIIINYVKCINQSIILNS